MEKIDNFKKCLDAFQNVDFRLADGDEIYRMGVASLFNLTFESSRKAIKEALTLYGARDDLLNSPRETLKTAYKFGFIDNSDIWLSMLKDRNESIRVYDSQKNRGAYFENQKHIFRRV